MGLIAGAITLFVGLSFTDLSWQQILFTILTANLVNFISLFVGLKVERIPVVKRIFSNTPKMWVLFWILFHAQIWLICPWMRDVKTTLILWLPLFFSGAYAALLFGPIQDRIVLARQKRERSSTR